jgi:hypothetical protein
MAGGGFFHGGSGRLETKTTKKGLFFDVLVFSPNQSGRE